MSAAPLNMEAQKQSVYLSSSSSFGWMPSFHHLGRSSRLWGGKKKKPMLQTINKKFLQQQHVEKWQFHQDKNRCREKLNYMDQYSTYHWEDLKWNTNGWRLYSCTKCTVCKSDALSVEGQCVKRVYLKKNRQNLLKCFSVIRNKWTIKEKDWGHWRVQRV